MQPLEGTQTIHDLAPLVRPIFARWSKPIYEQAVGGSRKQRSLTEIQVRSSKTNDTNASCSKISDSLNEK